MSIHPINVWPPKENFPVPLIHSRWQKELVQVAGLSPNGYPMLRLEWGSTCTWTNTNRDLKYLHRRQTRQTAWGVHVYNPAGEIVKTLKFGLKANIPEPNATYGNAFPISVDEQIGIPRFWISQYVPPSLVGPWDDARQRLLSQIDSRADMGAFPREGFYYLGFHLIAQHGSDGSGVNCCEKSKDARVKCFGLYRDPSDLDILYSSELWRRATIEPNTHHWTEVADDKTMRKVLMNLNSEKEVQSEKEREEMRLRIRDAFRTHRGRLTSRKGQDTFIFSSK